MTSAIEASGMDVTDSLLQQLIAAAVQNTRAAYGAVAGATPELVDNAVEAARDAYVQGFRLVYLVAVAFGVLATIAAACTVSTDKSKKNNQRAVVTKDEVRRRDAMMLEKTAA